jgi:hypothetical protein
MRIDTPQIRFLAAASILASAWHTCSECCFAPARTAGVANSCSVATAARGTGRFNHDAPDGRCSPIFSAPELFGEQKIILLFDLLKGDRARSQ